MRILWVEDDITEIDGMQAQCEASGWVRDLVGNFCDAAKILGAEDNQFDIVIIDLMLPWGNEATDWVLQNYSEETAGLRLLEAMRSCGEGQSILEKLGLPHLRDRHNKTPVVILSKFPKKEDECRRLGIVQFFCKRSYDWKSLTAVIGSFAHD